MHNRLKTIIGASALAAGLLAAPVIVYAQGDTVRMMGGGADNMMGGSPMIGHGSRRSMMSGGMMAGCAGMMQSMNNGGDGRPNSQWQKHPPRNPDNGG